MESNEKSGKILTPEAYAKRHTGAFRCAFDFLNQHFPPEPTVEWWDPIGEEISKARESQEDNMLAVSLLIAVSEYIEDEWKIRRRERNEETQH